jgi:hypothetical protein
VFRNRLLKPSTLYAKAQIKGALKTSKPAGAEAHNGPAEAASAAPGAAAADAAYTAPAADAVGEPEQRAWHCTKPEGEVRMASGVAHPALGCAELAHTVLFLIESFPWCNALVLPSLCFYCLRRCGPVMWLSCARSSEPREPRRAQRTEEDPFIFPMDDVLVLVGLRNRTCSYFIV